MTNEPGFGKLWKGMSHEPSRERKKNLARKLELPADVSFLSSTARVKIIASDVQESAAQRCAARREHEIQPRRRTVETSPEACVGEGGRLIQRKRKSTKGNAAPSLLKPLVGETGVHVTALEPLFLFIRSTTVRVACPWDTAVLPHCALS